MSEPAGLERGYRRLLAWYPANSSGDDLLGHPTPSHLTLLFLQPVLVAVVAVLTAIARRGVPLPSEPGQPGVA